MSRRFAVVHEAEADFMTATALADRVLVESIDWLDADALQHHREWFAEAVGGGRLTWKGIKQLARDANIKIHGHFDGEPGLPDASAARRAIHYLVQSIPNLQAIVLIRDQDDQPARLKGLEQARKLNHHGIPIVIGLAIVERECWVISGFEPMNDDESTRLEAERKRLGFDPRVRSHALTACKNDNADRSPKRVLRDLTVGDREREHRCLMETSLTLLQDRGAENGLARYLIEIRNHLASLIGRVGV